MEAENVLISDLRIPFGIRNRKTWLGTYSRNRIKGVSLRRRACLKSIYIDVIHMSKSGYPCNNIYQS
jgi:hypothetical protein